MLPRSLAGVGRRLGISRVLPWPRPGVARQQTNRSLRLRYRDGYGHDRGAMDAGESDGSTNGIRAELNVPKRVQVLPGLALLTDVTYPLSIAARRSRTLAQSRCACCTNSNRVCYHRWHTEALGSSA